MGKSKRAKLLLDDVALAELKKLANSKTCPHREVQRAKILCAYHRGENLVAIGKEVGAGPKAVYTIGILDFIFAEDQDNQEVFHHEVKLVDQSTQKVFYDKLTYIYLEMPKFKKTEQELETHFDKWLYVLRNLEDLTKRPEKLQEKIFAKLFEQAELANYSEQEYTEYEHSLKVYRDLNNVIETAESKGEKRGEERGMAKGEVRGIAKGKAERDREIARTMLAKGLDIQLIMEITQLSKEEIEQLKS